jgi:hypothetical protein
MCIQVGSKVRSFDFEDQSTEGERACFIDGEVVEMGRFPDFPDCDRYKLRVERHVFGGEQLAEHEEFVFPPLNDTPTTMGRKTEGVVLLTDTQ